MKNVMISFDIEEFDMPFEYGQTISFEDQIQISEEGTRIILQLLNELDIKATFFSTATFALQVPALIKQIISDGHELASHGYFHSKFEEVHLTESKAVLEKLSGKPIAGFRMARMMPVNDQAIKNAGYIYNSSLNPVYLPGRYNNFFAERTIFQTADGLIQVPASATPILRLPLFWLSFHNFPLWLYKACCVRTINHDDYLNIYFHPWEFINLKDSRFRFPRFISRNSGHEMANRFHALVSWMKTKDYTFSTINTFLQNRLAR